ncbi:MAG: HNH endonuclease [Ilumatobacter sp.]|nr:HNH endonuclease signature motif containing protein [Ilumatobacter sp.]MDJ0770813.1 HNH endonuclease [Ilumatobacter sp.]
MRHPPDAVYAEVRDTDPDVLDADGLTAHVGRLAVLRAWLDAEQVRSTRAQRRLAEQGRAADPASSLARDSKQSSKEAKAAAEREEVCSAMPGFEDALTAGEVSAGHVDAVAAAVRNLDEAEAAEFAAEAESLLGDAARQGVDAFAKNCRDMAKSIRARHNSRADVDELEAQRAQSKISRWVDKQTGMHKTLIECDPVTDRMFWSAIQGTRSQLRRRNQQTGAKGSWDRLTVDALVEAVSRTGGGRARTGMVVHIDLATLTGGRHDTTLCETDSGMPLPVDTVRRMACDADIIPVVLNGDGVVLDEGRAKRLATFEQRIAIEAMQATCSHPDCTVTIDDCRIHHLTPWRLGGCTDLADLAPVCEPHHHLIHEGGWTFTMTPDRVATWTRPDGQHYWTGTLNDRTPIAA